MKPDFLYINSRDSLLRLNINHIVYFEADGNYTIITSANAVRHTVGMTLAKVQDMLTESLGQRAQRFVRIGKSHIVSMNYISLIDIPKQTLTLSDDRTFTFKVSVSKEALRKLKEIFIKQGTK